MAAPHRRALPRQHRRRLRSVADQMAAATRRRLQQTKFRLPLASVKSSQRALQAVARRNEPLVKLFAASGCRRARWTPRSAPTIADERAFASCARRYFVR